MQTITPPTEHVVTAREAIEPLYDKLELKTECAVLAAAVEAGWPLDEPEKALATIKLQDALTNLNT